MFHFQIGLNQQRRTRPMQLLQFGAGDAYAVHIDQRRKNWVGVNLHWDGVAQRRVPCVGVDCVCRGRGQGWAMEERVYVPVQAARLNTVGAEFVFPGYFLWAHYLMGFTEGILDVLYVEGGSGQWAIRRARGKRNGKMIAHPMVDVKAPDQWADSYPVLETLERVFGARTDPGR